MNKFKTLFQGLQTFLLLWSTQAFSALGSSMTSYSLILWSYQQKGSALTTALLTVCSYAPYVIFSIFAGALSDRWNKKYTMLICDSFAALSTIAVLVLLQSGRLEIWHLYLINGFNGLMNTVQQPASDVTVSLLTPKEQYHRAGGLRTFSNSLVTVLTPVIATAFWAVGGIAAVISFDLITFAAAFVTLAFFIRIPKADAFCSKKQTSVFRSALEGLRYLGEHKGVFHLILFLAAINLVASMYNAALPAMLLSRNGGSETALGLVNTCAGLANLAGSIMVSLSPAPKNRIRVICNTLLFSMSTENFLLALGRGTPIWCIGSVLGWLCIPFMNTNLDVVLRSQIPLEIQGRVYALRNTFQFFTIPLGYLLGGYFIDRVLEPLMQRQTSESPLRFLFGPGKGTGAALLFLLLGAAGVMICLVFRKDKHIWKLQEEKDL